MTRTLRGYLGKPLPKVIPPSILGDLATRVFIDSSNHQPYSIRAILIDLSTCKAELLVRYKPGARVDNPEKPHYIDLLSHLNDSELEQAVTNP